MYLFSFSFASLQLMNFKSTNATLQNNTHTRLPTIFRRFVNAVAATATVLLFAVEHVCVRFLPFLFYHFNEMPERDFIRIKRMLVR